MTLTAELDPREWRTGKAKIHLSIPAELSPMGELVSTTSGIAVYDNADDGPECVDVQVIPAGAVLCVRDGDEVTDGTVIAQW